MCHPFFAQVNNLTPHALITKEFTQKRSHHNALDRFVASMCNFDDLPENILDEAKKIFNEVLKEEGSTDSSLQWQGFKTAVEKITRENIDSEEILLIFNDIDLDNNKSIDIDEFLKYCTLQHARAKDDRLSQLLIKLLDPKNDGFIKVETVKTLVAKQADSLPVNFSESIITKLLGLADSSGHISYKHFAIAMDSDDAE
jgi:Ca2+-binding EF-hand superfamily protein